MTEQTTTQPAAVSVNTLQTAHYDLVWKVYKEIASSPR